MPDRPEKLKEGDELTEDNLSANRDKVCSVAGCPNLRAGKSKYCADHRDIAFQRWKELLQEQSDARKQKDAMFAAIWDEAIREGTLAAERVTPTPVKVAQREDFIDDAIWTTGAVMAPEGVHGRAWITVRPGTHPFVHWCRKYHSDDTRKGCRGGVIIYYVSAYGQSLERKTAFASAFCKVLIDHDIPAFINVHVD